MDSMDLSGSRMFGEINFHPSCSSQESYNQTRTDEFVKCQICRGEHGSNHYTANCPSLIFQQLNRQEYNPWVNQVEQPSCSQPTYGTYDGQWSYNEQCSGGNWVDSSCEPTQNNSQWNSSRASECAGAETSQSLLSSSEPSSSLEARIRAQEDTIFSLRENMVLMEDKITNLMGSMRTKIDAVLEQHAEHIQALEHAKSSSDKVVEAQAEQIKSLEATVEKLETRLKHQEQEQARQHGANLRRIEQINVEVPNLRKELARVDSLCRAQQEQVEHIHQSYIDDSSDDDGMDVTLLRKVLSFMDEKQKTDEAAQKKIEHISTPTPTKLTEERVNNCKKSRATKVQFQEDITVIEYDPAPVTSPRDDRASCSYSSLPGGPQLVACVNMIQVAPMMRKVEEDEIKTMKSRTKRKLQKLWVPRGIFELQELFQLDKAEDQNENSIMPWWKKRQRGTPTSYDSFD